MLVLFINFFFLKVLGTLLRRCDKILQVLLKLREGFFSSGEA